MSREYGTIAHCFWDRGTGRKLRGDAYAQAIASYLMTCKASTLCGVFSMAADKIAYDLGHPIAEVERCLKLFQDLDLIRYDAEAEIVWVIKLAYHQLAKSLAGEDRRKVAFMRSLASQTPHALSMACADYYRAMYDLGSWMPPPPAKRATLPPIPPSQPSGALGIASTSASHVPTSDIAGQDMAGSGTSPQKNTTCFSEPPAGGQATPSAAPAHGPTPAANEGEAQLRLTPPSRPPPAPPSPAPAKRGRKRMPASFVDMNWRPSQATIEWAHSKHIDPEPEIEEFINHWRATGKSMCDWEATFRKRLLQLVAYGRAKRWDPPPPPPEPKPEYGPSVDAPPELEALFAAAAANTNPEEPDVSERAFRQSTPPFDGGPDDGDDFKSDRVAASWRPQ